MDSTDDEDQRNDQQDKPGVLLLVGVEPTSGAAIGLETYGQDLVVHVVHRIVDRPVGQLV